MSGFNWSDKARERVGQLLREGLTAREIGIEMRVSRNAIIGIVGRDKTLSAIGFARSKGRAGGGGNGPGVGPKRVNGTKVYSFPKRPAPKPEPTRVFVLPAIGHNIKGGFKEVVKPSLKVITNTALTVEDWLAANGGPRRFARGDSCDYFSLQKFFEEHGYGLSQQKGKYRITVGSGRPKEATWSAVVALADKLRTAVGLEPFRRRA